MTLDLSAIKDNLNDASDGQLIKYVMSLIKEVERMQAKLDVAVNTLNSSKQWLYLGTLELSAHMGIPEKKRESMIREIVSNYDFMIEESLKKIEKL